MEYKTRRMTPGISRQRMIIRRFRTEEGRQRHIREMEADLKNSNTLFITEYDGELPPGTYAFVGGEWRDVKTLDRDIIPHV
jgi:hypothetical protein